jgi:hypothetical protein
VAQVIQVRPGNALERTASRASAVTTIAITISHIDGLLGGNRNDS